jgi:hypothetical protein
MMTIPNKPSKPGAVEHAPLPAITRADAEQEAEADRLFSDAPPAPPAYPALTISTTVVDPDGFVWSVTFADTSLAAAAAILQKRGCRPAHQPSPASAPNTNHGSQPPICPDHGKPMKPMSHPDRQGRAFWCTQKRPDGDGYCEQRA